MLRVVGCWKWCEVGISVEGNELRAEGWDTCLLRWKVFYLVFALFLSSWGQAGGDLLVAEASESDSPPVSGGRGEADMFCKGENMPFSQLPGFLAEG
jgi:hypothetical protein